MNDFKKIGFTFEYKQIILMKLISYVTVIF